MQDIADGTYFIRDPPRFPLILTPDGPISSAKQLQQLLKLDSLPETIETSQIALEDDSEIRRVEICHVSYEEKDELEKLADVSPGIEDCVQVMFQGKPRWAMTVKSLNAGVRLDKEEAEPEKEDAKEHGRET